MQIDSSETERQGQREFMKPTFLSFKVRILNLQPSLWPEFTLLNKGVIKGGTGLILQRFVPQLRESLPLFLESWSC